MPQLFHPPTNPAAAAGLVPQVGRDGFFKIARAPMAGYAGTAVFSLVILAVILAPWKADWTVPFGYAWRDARTSGRALDPGGSGDVLLFSALIKGVQENGWFLHNPHLGAPGGLELEDYPFLDNLHFLILKGLSVFTSHFGITYNLFFVLTFPLTALTCLLAFRALRLSWSSAILGSLLFTFLPYHFLRGEQHILLAAYYFVPFTSLAAVWLARGEPLLLAKSDREHLALLTPRGWACAAVCAVTPATGAYYGAFGGFLLLTATLYAWNRQRTSRPLLAGGIYSGIWLLSFLANAAPSLFYRLMHGSNSLAIFHPSAEAETHGLKIIQLLMPICQHRLGFLSDFAVAYARRAPLVAENSTACLGTIGSCGFLVLLAWALGFKWRLNDAETMNTLGFLNVASVLMATVGGFSSLFAFAISPILRCYNRMSVHIAFFSLLALAILLDEWRSRKFAAPPWRSLWPGFAGLLLTAGIADQTSPVFEPLYAEGAVDWRRDEEFVQRLEKLLPQGASVFELPYIPFPVSVTQYDYELLRGYLHSRHLRWSYAAMKGRDTDRWERTKVLPGGQLDLSVLQEAGFSGIYLDLIYYQNDDFLVKRLKEKVDAAPLTSVDGRLLFFNFAHLPQER